MSRRQRTTKRSLCTPEQWLDAKRRVEEGESKRQVAKSLGMNEATLRKRLKRTSPAKSLGRYSQTFTSEMEAELCDYIKKIDNMLYGLTTKKFEKLHSVLQRRMAYKIVLIKKRKWLVRSGFGCL